MIVLGEYSEEYRSKLLGLRVSQGSWVYKNQLLFHTAVMKIIVI
jgi:hypothetical protein